LRCDYNNNHRGQLISACRRASTSVVLLTSNNWRQIHRFRLARIRGTDSLTYIYMYINIVLYVFVMNLLGNRFHHYRKIYVYDVYIAVIIRTVSRGHHNIIILYYHGTTLWRRGVGWPHFLLLIRPGKHGLGVTIGSGNRPFCVNGRGNICNGRLAEGVFIPNPQILPLQRVHESAVPMHLLQLCLRMYIIIIWYVGGYLLCTRRNYTPYRVIQ